MVAKLFISSEAFTRNSSCSNTEICKKSHFVEASILAVQTTTQLNAAFRTLEYDISAEKDELNRIRMQEFAIHAEESIRAQRQLHVQEAGKEIRRYEHASGTLIKYPEGHLPDQSLESLTPKFRSKGDRVGQASIAKSRIVLVAQSTEM